MWHLIIAFVVCVVIASVAMWLSFKIPVKKEASEELLMGTESVTLEPESPPADEPAGPTEPQP